MAEQAGGVLIGHRDDGGEVRLTDGVLASHVLVVGRRGCGRSGVLERVLRRRLEELGSGAGGAVVLLDPDGEMADAALEIVPAQLAERVRFLDFGGRDFVPLVNPVGTGVFPDRQSCVEFLLRLIAWESPWWGPRMENFLRHGLGVLWEFNAHRDTVAEEQLTLLDLLPFLEGGLRVGAGGGASVEPDTFQRQVLARVEDGGLLGFMDQFLKWDPGLRADEVAPVRAGLGRWGETRDGWALLGQRKTAVKLDGLLKDGLVLVSGGRPRVGRAVAALMTGAMLAMVQRRGGEGGRCTVFCSDVGAMPGTDWGLAVSDGLGRGLEYVLSAETLSGWREARWERLLGDLGCLACYRVDRDDAELMAMELGGSAVQPGDLTSLEPLRAFVRTEPGGLGVPASMLLGEGRSGEGSRVRELVQGRVPAYSAPWPDVR